MNKRRVRFAPTSKVAVFVHRTKGIEDKLWYSSDDVDQFKLKSTLYAGWVRDKISQGSFDSDIGNIIGLEKLICYDEYTLRKELLKAVVFEEQAFQRLSSSSPELKDRVAIYITEPLAKVAEENSRWARECAHVAGLALQRDLFAYKSSAEQRQRDEILQGSAVDGIETNFSTFTSDRIYETESSEAAETFDGSLDNSGSSDFWRKTSYYCYE